MVFLIILVAIAIQIFLTHKKVSPFLSLLLVAIFTGLALGMPPVEVLKSVEKGIGSTMGSVALIICLGAIMGKILETSGAATRISSVLIEQFGLKNIQWAVMFSGFMIGIPLFYNAGFVILLPLIFTLARNTGLPLLYIAMPMAASLSTTHCFLPPHPGPAFLVGAFQANMGWVLIYGIVVAVPAVIVAGPVLGRLLRHIQIDLPDTAVAHTEAQQSDLPATAPSFLVALMPITLITIGVLATQFLPEGSRARTILAFTGDTTIALMLTVLAAMLFFGLLRGHNMETITRWLNAAIADVALIVLIIAAGGVLKQVLTDSGTAQYIASFSSKWQMHPLLFGWLVTAVLRVLIGSATVAGVTAAGIVGPLVASGGASPELMVLAVGSGSVFGSHVNDSGFWMFKEFFKASISQTFLSWTVMESVISIMGLIGVLILDVFV